MKRLLFIPLIIFMIGHFSCDSTVESEEDLDAPEVPTGLQIIAGESGDGEIKLSWLENDDNDLDEYLIYRSENGDVANEYEKITETEETEYLDVGLEYDITYYYRISAIDRDDNESEKSGPVSIAPINISVPQAPDSVKVYGHNYPGFSPYIEIMWKSNSETDFSHYNIYKSTGALFLANSNTFLANTTSTIFQDDSVEVGERWYYKITAVDKGDEEETDVDVVSDIVLPTPVLTSPAHNDMLESLHPTFEWDIVSGSMEYKTVILDGPDGNIVWEGISTENSIELSDDDLLGQRSYFWKVYTYSIANAGYNSVSELWKFTTP